MHHAAEEEGQTTGTAEDGRLVPGEVSKWWWLRLSAGAARVVAPAFPMNTFEAVAGMLHGITDIVRALQVRRLGETGVSGWPQAPSPEIMEQ